MNPRSCLWIGQPTKKCVHSDVVDTIRPRTVSALRTNKTQVEYEKDNHSKNPFVLRCDRNGPFLLIHVILFGIFFQEN